MKLLFFPCLSFTTIAQDAKVAGRCVTCHKENKTGLLYANKHGYNVTSLTRNK